MKELISAAVLIASLSVGSFAGCERPAEVVEFQQSSDQTTENQAVGLKAIQP